MFSNVAIIHDWLVDSGGAEKVVAAFLDIFPDADLYTTVCYMNDTQLAELGYGKPVNTSFIQKLPLAKRYYRTYFPLMPFAVEQFDLSKYDLIISSSSSVAKGVITSPDNLHICYCHSPMRYAWDMQGQYLRDSGLEKGLTSLLARFFLAMARTWDVRSSFGVDKFVANSHFIAHRINKCYRRESAVIHPPVDTHSFSLAPEKSDYYVVCCRLVPYKRVDLIVEAFNRMPDKKLIVIGGGPELQKITAMAKSNITVAGRLAFSQLKEHLARSKAFVYAAEEDFGIVLVEALASGAPVIAYSRGGASEIVEHGKTGIHFHSQRAEAIIEAISLFEREGIEYSPSEIKESAERFSKENFVTKFNQFLSVSKEKEIAVTEGEPA
ncbi:glycosyltransferase family 4 protein [Zhongshania aliphaticivorans]|uniref:Glycosyl transferase n=1 Tax=Zhongshania aliphaticivorans TaxID=1470434 RepID=A0A127M183_9GAMM|nr:glycosyltransferase family 4 protein [Zhongshania aliphaticivorans]AMO66992.1 glycosyl transferase [Zhongshania aliphaticivorans]